MVPSLYSLHVFVFTSYTSFFDVEVDCLLLLVLRLTVLSLTCLLLVLLVDKAELWSTAELTTLSSRTRVPVDDDVVALSTTFVADDDDDTTGSARSAMRCDVIVVVAVDNDDVASSVAVTPTAAVPVDFGTL